MADAGGRAGGAATEWRGPGWPRVAVIVAVLLLAFFVARSCQQSQIRVTKQQAISIAERQVDFEPELTQIRLLRQGLNSKPSWFVVLGIPRREDENTFSQLAQFRVDANTGEVEVVRQGDARQQSQR